MKKRIELLVKLFYYASQCNQNPRIQMAFWNPNPIVSITKDKLGVGGGPGELIAITIDDDSQHFKIQYRRVSAVESLVYG